MDSKEVKLKFHQCSNEVINFLDKFERTTYISTLLVVNNNISAHQSNGTLNGIINFITKASIKTAC